MAINENPPPVSLTGSDAFLVQAPKSHEDLSAAADANEVKDGFLGDTPVTSEPSCCLMPIIHRIGEWIVAAWKLIVVAFNWVTCRGANEEKVDSSDVSSNDDLPEKLEIRAKQGELSKVQGELDQAQADKKAKEAEKGTAEAELSHQNELVDRYKTAKARHAELSPQANKEKKEGLERLGQFLGKGIRLAFSPKLKNEYNEVQSQLAELKEQMVDTFGNEVLKEESGKINLKAVNTKIQASEEKITALTAEIDDLSTIISTLESQVSELKGQIGKLQGELQAKGLGSVVSGEPGSPELPLIDGDSTTPVAGVADAASTTGSKQQKMLADLTRETHPEIAAMWQLLFDKFPGKEIVKDWDLKEDGTFTITLHKAFKMWTDDAEYHKNGGVVLMFGSNTNGVITGKLVNQNFVDAKHQQIANGVSTDKKYKSQMSKPATVTGMIFDKDKDGYSGVQTFCYWGNIAFIPLWPQAQSEHFLRVGDTEQGKMNIIMSATFGPKTEGRPKSVEFLSKAWATATLVPDHISKENDLKSYINAKGKELAAQDRAKKH